MDKITCNLVAACLLIMSTVSMLEDAHGQIGDYTFHSPEERELLALWDNKNVISSSILDGLLIAEGMSGQIARNNAWFSSLASDLKGIVDIDDTPLRKGEKLYTFLHERVLRKYSGKASAATLMTNGEYSCVTATALYYELGKIVGLNVTFHATPFHVCPVIEYKGRKVWVELTQPKDGFDVEYQRGALVEWLLESKMVTKDEVAEKGEEKVYNEFIGGHYQNSVAAILGYHYYNYGLKLDDQEKREETFWALAKARLLEHEDEAIENVFDASFRLASAAPKISSYAKVARVYLTLRGSDTSIVTSTMTSISEGVRNLVHEQRDFAQADSVLALAERFFANSQLVEKELVELRRVVTVNKALDLSRKGKSQEAFRIVSIELASDSANQKLKDIYVSVGQTYAQKLLSSGNDSLALSIVETMLKQVPEYVALRDDYLRFLVAGVMSTGKYRANPARVRASLLMAFTMDTTNTYVRQALALVHHELAMKEIRNSELRLAKGWILQGLRFAPDDEFLMSDLQLLRKESPKSK